MITWNNSNEGFSFRPIPVAWMIHEQHCSSVFRSGWKLHTEDGNEFRCFIQALEIFFSVSQRIKIADKNVASVPPRRIPDAKHGPGLGIDLKGDCFYILFIFIIL